MFWVGFSRVTHIKFRPDSEADIVGALPRHPWTALTGWFFAPPCSFCGLSPPSKYCPFAKGAGISVPNWCGLWVLDCLALGRRGQTPKEVLLILQKCPGIRMRLGLLQSTACLPGILASGLTVGEHALRPRPVAWLAFRPEIPLSLSSKLSC